MSLFAQVLVRGGIYLTFAGIGTAAIMDFDGFTPKPGIGEPVQMAMAVKWADGRYGAGDTGDTGGSAKLVPSAFAFSGDEGISIDMAKFAPGGEHWAKMNSDDPAVRAQALDDLYAAYGNDFMMQPVRDEVVVADNGDGSGRVPIPPVKPQR